MAPHVFNVGFSTLVSRGNCPWHETVGARRCGSHTPDAHMNSYHVIVCERVQWATTGCKLIELG